MSFGLREADFYMCFHPEALCNVGQGIKLPELLFASLALNEEYHIFGGKTKWKYKYEFSTALGK